MPRLTTYLLLNICLRLRMALNFIVCLTRGTINCTCFIHRVFSGHCQHSIIALKRIIFHCSLYLLSRFVLHLKVGSFLFNDKKLLLFWHSSFSPWTETFIPWIESFIPRRETLHPLQNCFTKNLKRIFPGIKTSFPYLKTFYKLIKTFWSLIKTFCKLKVASFPWKETSFSLMKTFCKLMETFLPYKAASIPGRKLPFLIRKLSVSLNLPTLSSQKVFIRLNIPFVQGGKLFVSIQKVFISIKLLSISLKHLFITEKKVIDKGIEYSFQGANELFRSIIPPQQEQNSRKFILFISELVNMKFHPLNSESYARLYAC